MNSVLSLFAFIFVTLSDTLSSAYAESWQGADGFEGGNVIMQAMASNNLIFVVLSVSLIIWFVLITYLIRLEKKLDRLEKQHPVKSSDNNGNIKSSL